MLGDVEVKEIVAGVSSSKEILEIMKWMETQHTKDQAILPIGVVSMDVEEFRITPYDWIKMTGKLSMTTRSEPLKSYWLRTGSLVSRTTSGNSCPFSLW